MTCIRYMSNNVDAIFCLTPAYLVDGFEFEFHDYLGPTLLKVNGKDFDENKQKIPKKFWRMLRYFLVNKKRKEKK